MANSLQSTANRFRFENLTVWQDSRLFIKHVYLITKSFPKEEIFGLTDQLRRAAISISLNIVEGSDRKSDLDFKRFLRISLTSLEEVVAGVYVAVDLNYLKQNNFDQIYNEACTLAAKINALIKKLTVN